MYTQDEHDLQDRVFVRQDELAAGLFIALT